MSDAQLRLLERAARASPDDTAALVAFARAYLRATAPPPPVTLSPDDEWYSLRYRKLRDVLAIDGLRRHKRGDVIKAVGTIHRLVIEGWRVKTIRDVAEGFNTPEQIPGIGPTRGPILWEIVAAAGLKFGRKNVAAGV